MEPALRPDPEDGRARGPLADCSRLEEAAFRLDVAAALLLKRPDQQLLAQAALFFAKPGIEHDAAAALQDFADLFFNPASGRYLPPLEEAVSRNSLGRRAADAAQAVYAAAGFEPARLDMDPLWRVRLRADHLGVQLAFVSALVHNATAQADPELLRCAASFHAARIAPWAGEYGRKLAQAAASALYVRTGQLLCRLAAWPLPA